jgi:hypothetical protein
MIKAMSKDREAEFEEPSVGRYLRFEEKEPIQNVPVPGRCSKIRAQAQLCRKGLVGWYYSEKKRLGSLRFDEKILSTGFSFPLEKPLLFSTIQLEAGLGAAHQALAVAPADGELGAVLEDREIISV